MRANAGEVEIALSAGARIVGRVVDEHGVAVPSFTVVALRRDGALARTPVAHSSVFDGDGQFELSGMAVGSYALVASAEGFAMSEETNAAATLLAELPNQTLIVLAPGGVLYGTVTSAADGGPLTGARVTAEGAIGVGPSAVLMSRGARCDDRGRFEVTGLRSGLASLLVAADHHHLQIVSGLEVTAGERRGPIAVSLTPLAADEEPVMELSGIGTALAAVEDGLAITSVMPGSGAADAGLVSGDVILAVDGDATRDLGFEGTVQRIRGPIGTAVRLTVRRGAAVMEFLATRKKVRA
jgi:hypothetical protein